MLEKRNSVLLKTHPWNLQEHCKEALLYPPVGVMVIDTANGGGVSGFGLIARPFKLDAVATPATFLRSCVAQALSRGDGPRHSLHTTT